MTGANNSQQTAPGHSLVKLQDSFKQILLCRLQAALVHRHLSITQILV